MESAMSVKISQIKSTLLDSLLSWRTQLHAALLIPFDDKQTGAPHGNSDFDGWLRRDPFVVRNPGNRYGRRSRGYTTSNGVGSLEVGAADD